MHRSGGGRAALTCRYRLSRHTPEPRATQTFPSASLPRFSPSCARDETAIKPRPSCNFAAPFSIFEELSKADSKNVDFLLNVAALHAKVGSALVALGRAEEAEHEYREALAIDQGVAIGSSPPAEIEYNRADSYFGLGVVEAKLAAAARQTDQQIEHWSQARSYYQKSLETWKGIQNPARVSPEGWGCGSPTKSSQAVGSADAALAKLLGSNAEAPHPD